jgi:hypothetical protein
MGYSSNMTVRERAGDAGDATGDTGGEIGVAGGEPLTPSPAAAQPQLNCGRGLERPVGRFWVLVPSDDEQEDEDAMVDTSVTSRGRLMAVPLSYAGSRF